MANTVNVEPTAEVIEEMAGVLEARANDLRNLAKSMRETNDLGYAAEAVSVIKNLTSNLRLDLLVTRPLRALGHK